MSLFSFMKCQPARNPHYNQNANLGHLSVNDAGSFLAIGALNTSVQGLDCNHGTFDLS